MNQKLRVADLIELLRACPPDQVVVAEYDGSLYPVLAVRESTVGVYPTYELTSGDAVCEIIYAEYR